MPLALKRARSAVWYTELSQHSVYVHCHLHWVCSLSRLYVIRLIHNRPSREAI